MSQHSRVVVRRSGSESVLRVMVEGPSLFEVAEWAQRIGQAIKKRLSP